MIRTACRAAVVAFFAATPAFAQKTLDVTKYGAIAGDGRDDSAAISAAVRAAVAGDTILIPAGAFDLASGISLKSGVSLSGSGVAKSTLRFVGSQSTSLISLDGVKGVQVSGFTLDGAGSANAVQGIWAQNASGLNIHDLRVKDLGASSGFAPHGIYFVSGVTDSRIANNTFSSIGVASEWGAGIRVGQGSSRNQILSNTIINTGRGGILCDNKSTDLIIRKNTVTGSGKTTEGLGIELWGGCDRSLVEGNKIDHWLSVDGSNRVAIRNNVIATTDGSYKFCGLEYVSAHDVVFSGNTVDGGQKVGISISGSGVKERALFAGNTIRNASTWGVQVQGDAGGARQLYFYGNTFTGSLRNSPATLYSPQGHGFRVNGDAHHIVVDANLITSNEGSGIQVTGDNVSSLRFANNTITGNKVSAVDSDSLTGTEWVNNRVSGNGVNNTLASTAQKLTQPTMQFAPETVARTGEELSFSFKMSDGSAPASVLWDFGDGLPSVDLVGKHIYEDAGNYVVSVVAWDGTGAAAFSQKTVTVSSAVPEPAAMIPAAMLALSVGLMARRRGNQRGD